MNVVLPAAEGPQMQMIGRPAGKDPVDNRNHADRRHTEKTLRKVAVATEKHYVEFTLSFLNEAAVRPMSGNGGVGTEGVKR